MKKIFLVVIAAAFVFILNSNSKSEQYEKSLIVQSTDSAITIAICPVSKEEFAQGKGKKISYLGKDYELCCDGCAAEFKAESIGYTGGVATCPICNHDDGSAEITMIHDGIKYYFCNENCRTKFSKNPDKVLEGYKK